MTRLLLILGLCLALVGCTCAADEERRYYQGYVDGKASCSPISMANTIPLFPEQLPEYPKTIIPQNQGLGGASGDGNYYRMPHDELCASCSQHIND